MDIVALQQKLTADGFVVSFQEMNQLILEIEEAITNGKLKESVYPQRGMFSIGQLIPLLLGVPTGTNSTNWWKKAIKVYPRLQDFKRRAVYQKNVTLQKKSNGVSSLDIEGIFLLAAVLRFGSNRDLLLPNPAINVVRTEKKVDPAITVIKGCVYVLSDTRHQALKIGFSVDIDNRLIRHRSSNPFLVPLLILPVSSQSKEKDLHLLLKEHRIDGTREWYKDSREIRQLIADNFFTKQ